MSRQPTIPKMFLNSNTLEMFGDECILYILAYFSSVEIFRLLQHPGVSLRLIRLIRYYLNNCHDLNTDILNLCELKFDEFCNYISEYSNNIKRLILNCNSLYTYNNNQGIQYLEQVRHFPNIEHLALLYFDEIINVQITSDVLVSLELVFPSFDCQMVSNDTLFLLLYQCNNLQYLRLRNTLISYNSLNCLAKIKKIVSFSAVDCMFPWNGLGVADFLSSNIDLRDLEILWLYKENANDAVICAIFEVMRYSLRNLKTLATLMSSTLFHENECCSENTPLQPININTMSDGGGCSSSSGGSNHTENYFIETKEHINNVDVLNTPEEENLNPINSVYTKNLTLTCTNDHLKTELITSPNKKQHNSTIIEKADKYNYMYKIESSIPRFNDKSTQVDVNDICILDDDHAQKLFSGRSNVEFIARLINLEYVTIYVSAIDTLGNLPKILSEMSNVKNVSVIELWYICPINRDIMINSRQNLKNSLNSTTNNAKFKFRSFH